MDVLLCVLALASITAIFLAIIAKPSKVLWVGVLLGTLAFSSMAAACWIENARMTRRAAAQFYSFEIQPPGIHVLRILSVPDVPGLNAHPVLKGTRRKSQCCPEEQLPVSDAQLRVCGWKVRSPVIGLHVHDDKCDCAPKDCLFDTGFDERFRNGTFEGGRA